MSSQRDLYIIFVIVVSTQCPGGCVGDDPASAPRPSSPSCGTVCLAACVGDDPASDSRPAPEPMDGRDGPIAAEQVADIQRSWAEYKGVAVEVVNSLDMSLRFIPPGHYMRGGERSPSETYRRYGGDVTWYEREHPAHAVTLPHGFLMSTTPVTQAQWESLMGTTVVEQRDAANPRLTLRGTGDSFPMYYVSWEDAMAFCRRLTERDRSAGLICEGMAYRLPTEAEWEYTCRAGTTTAFHMGDDDRALHRVAWYRENSEQQARPVGRKEANAFGLHDMHGNVYEWCHDRFEHYTQEHAIAPTGSHQGVHRIVRGGAWISAPGSLRSAYRLEANPDFRNNGVGFRVVLSRNARKGENN